MTTSTTAPSSSMPLRAASSSLGSRHGSKSALRALRLQAAVVRSFLDELEDCTESAIEGPVAEQLAEELDRLGRHLLEVSRNLAAAACIDDGAMSAERRSPMKDVA